jgi:hypothetical protein
VTGAAKRPVLGQLLEGDPVLPATQLHPCGTLHVFADRAAAPREAP